MSESNKAASLKNKQIIDAVISWVDGSDPVHQKKLNSYKDIVDISDRNLPTGRDSTRFSENGELWFCVASIRRFAPWVRTIFLITDNQRPHYATEEWLQTNKVEIIDHARIFESLEFALPTFNSRTIESVVWRVPGIAGRFIYFNDDFILTRPVSPDDFFTKTGVVLRGRWKKQVQYRKWRISLNNFVSEAARKYLGITRSMHLLFQIKSAKKALFRTKYYRAPHVPHPVQTKTISEWFEKHPEELRKNVSWRFRSVSQFSAIYLANHLEISKKNVRFSEEDDHLMINGETDISLTFTKKLNRIVKGEVRFACIQAMEKLSPANRAELEVVLNQLTGASGQQSYDLRVPDAL